MSEKSLIAYFSRKGANYLGGNIVNLPVGNTEVATAMIQKITGSGMGRSESDIRKLCSGAKVKKGLPIRGGSVKEAEKEISKWVENNL